MPRPKESIKTARSNSITGKPIVASENAALDPILLKYADLIPLMNDLMDAKVKQLRNELKNYIDALQSEYRNHTHEYHSFGFRTVISFLAVRQWVEQNSAVADDWLMGFNPNTANRTTSTPL